MKTERNEPCPCGSEQIYEKCCLKMVQSGVPEEVAFSLNKQKLVRQTREQLGDYLPYPHAEYEGQRAVGVWSQILNRPLEETFHEFTMFILFETLGQDWINEQTATKSKHFIITCIEKYEEWKKKNAEDNPDTQRLNALPDGYARYIGSLAYDICALQKTNHLPKELIERLKNEEQFQGVRYEMAVAAIFSRLNFEIEFLDKKKRKDKHCEFYATHKEMGICIAVEAKSRHREGVLNYPGIYAKEKTIKRDFNKLINRATKKNPDGKLFFIFLDVNLPQSITFKKAGPAWFKDIKKKLISIFSESKRDKKPFDAFFVTNFSFHLREDKPTKVVESAFFVSKNIEESNPQVIEMINNALTHYGNLPDVY